MLAPLPCVLAYSFQSPDKLHLFRITRHVLSRMIFSVPSSWRQTCRKIGSSVSSRYEYGSSRLARSCSLDGACTGDEGDREDWLGTERKHLSITSLLASQFAKTVDIRLSQLLLSIVSRTTCLLVSAVECGSKRTGKMRLLRFCVIVSSTRVLDIRRKSLKAVMSLQIEEESVMASWMRCCYSCRRPWRGEKYDCLVIVFGRFDKSLSQMTKVRDDKTQNIWQLTREIFTV